MPLILNRLQLAASIFRCNLTPKVIPVKFLHPTFVRHDEEEEVANVDRNNANIKVPPSKDRSQVIPVETSMKYLKSSAYRQTYGNDPVWKHYRRNYKGSFLPRKTRKLCIRGGVVSTGSPCPICRDEYLILDYRNIDLLKQFISVHDGRILDCNVIGLCQKSYKDLRVAIMKAKDYGILTYDVPYRYYNYLEWKN
ncbi:28S ribosomal protein S18b, mitochondrial [Anthophora plagiata]